MIMNKTGLLPLCAVLGLFATVSPSTGRGEPELPKPIEGKGYRLVKDWDFGRKITAREQLDSEFHTRYVYNNGTLDTLNKEWQRFRDNNNHVFSGGVLKLTARIVGGMKNGGIESGMLRSKWTGKYGYYECSMKVPRGRGMWPAFWINPEDKSWPPEIDVVEIVNNGRDSTKNSFHILHNKHTAPVDIETKLDKWKSYKPGVDYADDFHIFAVEWTPEEVTHYVDGVAVARRRFYWTHNNGSDGGPAHLLVNLSVGGDWPGPPQAEADFPAELAIRFIRVWQLEEKKLP